MAINNKISKALDAHMGRRFEWMARTYQFISWAEAGERIIIATDQETIERDTDGVEIFLSGLIERGGAVAVAAGPSPIILRSMNEDVQTGIVEGLRSVFDELAKAQTPEKIKGLSLKASNMVKITQALTGVAKLELDIAKQSRSKK